MGTNRSRYSLWLGGPGDSGVRGRWGWGVGKDYPWERRWRYAGGTRGGAGGTRGGAGGTRGGAGGTRGGARGTRGGAGGTRDVQVGLEVVQVGLLCVGSIMS